MYDNGLRVLEVGTDNRPEEIIWAWMGDCQLVAALQDYLALQRM